MLPLDTEYCLIVLAAVFGFVVAYNNQRFRNKLNRSAIIPHRYSAWTFLYKRGDDPSFTAVTGLNRASFEELHRLLFPDEEIYPTAPGRKRILDSRARVGLYLLYIGSRMKINELCLIFGITPTTASDSLTEMINLVVDRLFKEPRSRICFPNEDQMQEFARMVNVREPKVDNIIGFIDGVSIAIQCSSDEDEQRSNFNGYYHDTVCNNVFAFAPNGKIIHASINFPGHCHDSEVCRKLIEKVIRSIGHYAFCVDQGFPRSGELFDKFVGPYSKRSRQALAPIVRKQLLERSKIYISLRQASEWGMRALQGTFTRLKSRLTADHAKRQKLLLGIILIHNFRTDLMGLNQITTVFNPEYEQYINVENYDRIARYFDFNDVNFD